MAAAKPSLRPAGKIIDRDEMLLTGMPTINAQLSTAFDPWFYGWLPKKGQL
jgi:hypothetical protein